MTPLRQTTIVQVETLATGLIHVVVGLIFMAVGFWLLYYGIQHPPTITLSGGCTTAGLNKPFLVGGGVTAIFGALLMPTILTSVKQIIVVGQSIPIVGNFLGGRRATDAPTPPRSIDEPPPDPKG